MIGTQLFISNATPMLELLVPVANDPDDISRQKPLGGLWTSSWRQDTEDSGWVEWCRGENYGNHDNLRWFLLTPHADCNLYTIDSLADFKRCLQAYGKTPEIVAKYVSFSGRRVIDFEKLAKEFDGLHLTERGNGETHLSYPNDLNAWDCESTLWFRWCFADIQAIATPVVEEVSA